MINFVYSTITDKTVINDFIGSENFICDINIFDTGYALDPLGYIYPNVKVRNAQYLNYIRNILSNIININSVIKIYVNVDDIYQNDQFEVYEINDAYPHDDHFVLLWKLKSRSINDYSSKSISLKYQPLFCPICSEKLTDVNNITDDGDVDNIKRCTNSLCWMNRYVSIDRYLSIACKLPFLVNFAKPYIDVGKVQRPSDLYRLDVYDAIFVTDPPIEKQLEILAETRGKIVLSDYLISLPSIDYNVDGFKLKINNINNDFTPSKFVSYINTLFTYFKNEQKRYDYANNFAYSSWVENWGSDIIDYMSIPAFFEYAVYFYKNNNNIMSLTELEDMGVFKQFKLYS